jgi:hypothetical protein
MWTTWRLRVEVGVDLEMVRLAEAVEQVDYNRRLGIPCLLEPGRVRLVMVVMVEQVVWLVEKLVSIQLLEASRPH